MLVYTESTCRLSSPGPASLKLSTLSSNCLMLPRLTFKISGTHLMNTKLANPTLNFPILPLLFSLLSMKEWTRFNGTSKLSDT